MKAAKAATAQDPLSLSLRENEFHQIINALRQTRGNVKKAAELLGIGRKTIYRKIEKYGIDQDAMRLP